MSEDLHENTRRVLVAIADIFGGRASTADITDATDLSNSLAGYHLDVLVDRGLIELVERGDVGERSPNVYEATAAGSDVAAEVAGGVGFNDQAVELDRLRSDVDQLQANYEELREDFDQLVEVLAEHVDAIES